MEDRERIKQIQRGDAEQFRELIEKYYDDIFRFCCDRTGNREAAYDCTQDTFLHLIRYIGGYTDRRKFRAWLFTIARNACYDYFRNKPPVYRNAVFTEDYADTGRCCEGRGVVSGQRTVEEQVIEAVETRELLRAALKRLPEPQREVVRLRFFHEFKLKEIADITGAPLPTVKSRLRQGLAGLREIMEGSAAK